MSCFWKGFLGREARWEFIIVISLKHPEASVSLCAALLWADVSTEENVDWICTINHPGKTTSDEGPLRWQRCKACEENHAEDQEVCLHPGLRLRPTKSTSEDLHFFACTCVSCQFHCDYSHSVFLSAAGQTLWVWGSQEVSRQRNSPGRDLILTPHPKHHRPCIIHVGRQGIRLSMRDGKKKERKDEGRGGSKQRCEEDRTWGTGTCEKEIIWYRDRR